jgi:hypothetical protein
VCGRRVASAAAVVIALAVAGPAVTGPDTTAGAVQASGSVVASRAGLATGPEILWASDADQNADYAAVAASGATWTTIDFDWNHIQDDGPGVWRWNAATDRAVLSARAHGLKIISVAGYSPQWARRFDCPPGELHCFPQNAADYGRFMGAAAARYGSRSTDDRLRGSVTVWSLWNEPNHKPFSEPKPDPDKYAAMVKSAYVAIKAADPTATVLTGGTSPAPDAPDGTDYEPATWLAGLYARGARGYFDGVAHHPYSFPTNPLDAHDWNAYTQTQHLYDLMVINGDSAKKVWGTEMGAPTGTASKALSEAQQAQWVRDYFTGWNTTFRSFTGPLVMFRLRDRSTNPAILSDNFGLLRLNRTPKPSYGAYQQVMGTGVSDPPADFTGTTVPSTGKRVVNNPTGGYYTLERDGTVNAFDGAAYLGSPRLPLGLARGMVVAPDGLGYLVLDGYGGVHKFGSARTGPLGAGRTGYFGWDIARAIALTPDGKGYTVLDGFGGLHVTGAAPRFALGYWPGWDIARDFTYSPSGAGAYMLDGFGGLHVGGDARRRRGGGYWSGWDIARDVALTDDNGGYAVVDGYGGVHRTGNAPGAGTNLAWKSWDHAGGLAMVNGGYVVAGR